MATSRLADHLPSLFGPSRRAAWRLLALRRMLAATALLLALHLTLSATRTEQPAASQPPETVGASLSLPLAAPADHLASGDEVGVYLPGQVHPLVSGARVLGTDKATDGAFVVRITLRQKDVGPIVREMGPESGGSAGFVVVREG